MVASKTEFYRALRRPDLREGSIDVDAMDDVDVELGGVFGRGTQQWVAQEPGRSLLSSTRIEFLAPR